MDKNIFRSSSQFFNTNIITMLTKIKVDKMPGYLSNVKRLGRVTANIILAWPNVHIIY